MQQRLQLLVVVGVGGFEFRGAVDIHFIHTQGELADGAQVGQFDFLFALRYADIFLQLRVVFRGGDVALAVAQVVHAMPRSPALQGHVDVLPFLLGGGVGIVFHVVVAVDGQLAALGQVLEFGDERVEALDVLRFVQRLVLDVFRLLVEQHGFAGEEHSVAVAHLQIVVAKLACMTGRYADEAQQVIAEVAAVVALDDEGLIVGGLHGSQLVGVGHRLVVVFLAYLLMAQLVEPAVVVVDVAQHGVVDGLQRVVVGSQLGTLLQLLHDGFQRVGCHLALRLGTLQPGLQQLAVDLLLLGFRHDLAQCFLLRLRQVVVLGVLHLFPQGAVCLRECKHRHHQTDYGC